MVARITVYIILTIVFQSLNAQNVGIGTTNPVNKLSVDGSTNITGRLGIGTATPAGRFHVKSSPVILDQQQTIANQSSGVLSQWQSFTAGLSGTLVKVDLKVSSPLLSSSSPGTIKIYAGEGVSGTLLSTSQVTFQNVNNTFQSFELTGQITVNSGNIYTIEISVPSIEKSWVYLADTNPYSGGISSYGSTKDFLFKTYITNESYDALVVFNENVGIGTATPTAHLDIVGNIKITDGTQATGKVLTSDANGLASWSTLSGISNPGSTAGNTPYWNGTTWVTNSSNIFNNGGNVGIGTNNPSSKLEIAGKIKIADGTQGSAKVLTSDANGLASWSTLNGILSPGSTAGNTIFWDGSKWVTNSNNIFNDGTKVGIGTKTPAGKFHVKSSSVTNVVLDQQQTTGNQGAGGLSQWQSFTAGLSGTLVKVDLNVSSPLLSSSSPGTIKIYAGEGVSGTLLSTTQVTYQDVLNTFQSFELSGQATVNSGNVYTIELSAPSTNVGWIDFADTNPYSGGRSSFGSSTDLKFKTYVSDENYDALVVCNENVGIGTATPTAHLDIIGNIKITDGTQATGKVLTSDANGLASWSTLSGITNPGSTAGNTIFWDGSNWVTNSNNIFNDGTKVGIGTYTPAGKFHVKSSSVVNGVLDQQQTIGNLAAGSLSQWQSFTAGLSGTLVKVDLEVASPLSPSSSPGTIKIYAGEGVSGTLLSTTQVTFQNVYTTFQSFELSGQTTVDSGNVYTIEFSVPNKTTGWVYFADTNPYSGGRSSYGPYKDFLFKTYVSDENYDALVVYNENVGIGTTTPTAHLDIVGNIKITDGTQATGKVLTSDANGLASWQMQGASGWALTGNTGISASTNFLGTTDNHSLRFRTNNTQKMIVDSLGNVGIGILIPKIKLDLDTNQIIGTSKTIAALHNNANRGTKMSFGYNGTDNEFAGMRVMVKAGTNTCGNSGDVTFNTWECNTSVSREIMRINGSGNVGIGTSAPTAKLSVNGTANNTTGSWSVFSDSRIKRVNSDFTDGLNVINKIHPVKFKYTNKAPNSAPGEQIGIVAQELEQIAPYMVTQKDYQDIKDLREVNNQAYVFLLINAVKELSAQNEQLKAEISSIKNKLGLDVQVSQASNKF